MPTLRLEKTNFIAPVIKLTIKGQEKLFIVDTGADVSSIDHSLLPPMSHKQAATVQHGQFMGAGGVENTFRVQMCFNILGQKLTTVYVSDLSKRISEDTGLPFGGLIGQDLLCQFKQVIFDNDKHTVEFVPR